mgnify:CR=1 FL=1
MITLTTDFGEGSHYVAAVKGVILSINPAAVLVDLTHAIRPHDIRHGAIVLADVAPYFPPETIHLAVVDPGVGTDRPLVYARMGAQHFLAPDNGLLSLLARRWPPSRIIRLDKPKYWLQPTSATFQGRDILAPVAARLSLGFEPDRLGSPQKRLVDFHWPEVRLSPDKIVGSVLMVDSFGNLITNITAKMFSKRPTDHRAHVICGTRETWGIHRTYGEMPPGNFIALVGSSGRLELAVVEGNAAARFNIQPGTPVTVTWEQPEPSQQG